MLADNARTARNEGLSEMGWTRYDSFEDMLQARVRRIPAYDHHTDGIALCRAYWADHDQETGEPIERRAA